MHDAIRLYLRYIGISLRSQVEYRASTFMLAIGTLVLTAVEFSAVWALFARFGTLRGWVLWDVAVLYGMASTSFALAEAFLRGFDVFDRMIVRGDFDRILVRPRSTAFQILAQELQLMRVGRLTQGLVVLTVGMAHGSASWTPSTVALLVGSLFGGACIFAGLFVLHATLAFFTVQSLEVMHIVTYGGVETAQFPLSIYTPGFRRFFTFVIPLAFLNYLPALTMLGRAEPGTWETWAGWMSPLVGPVFLALSLQVWRIGVRHYQSTGS
jgi:ABC-2 type transport system permease protein